MTTLGWVELGRATTEGQMLPLGVDDPVVAARAVRRALAQAQRRAVDVTALAIASSPAIEQTVVADFARRALGAHGYGIRLATVALDALSPADRSAACAADELAAADLIRHGVGIAVGLGSDGTTVALCIVRPDHVAMPSASTATRGPTDRCASVPGSVRGA